MNNCPICDKLILRHISQKQIYWYCSCCHQEVPNFSEFKITKLLKKKKFGDERMRSGNGATINFTEGFRCRLTIWYFVLILQFSQLTFDLFCG